MMPSALETTMNSHRVEKEEYMLRYNLMREENEEYLEAAREGDLVEIADVTRISCTFYAVLY